MSNYQINKKATEQITAIKKGPNAKVVTVADLHKKLKNPNQYLNLKFIVNGFITGLVDHKYENVIKILEGQKVHDCNQKMKKGSSYKYIFNIIMLLNDHSKKNKTPLSVYLTTNDGEQNIFTNWEILPEGHNQ